MKVSLATAKLQSSSAALCVCGAGVRHPKLYFRFPGGAKCMDVAVSGTSRRTKCRWDPCSEELPYDRCHRISAGLCLSSRQISWGGKVRRTHRYSEHSCLLWGCEEPPETHRGRCREKVKRGKGGREEAVCLKAWLPLQAERHPPRDARFRPLKPFGIL